MECFFRFFGFFRFFRGFVRERRVIQRSEVYRQLADGALFLRVRGDKFRGYAFLEGVAEFLRFFTRERHQAHGIRPVERRRMGFHGHQGDKYRLERHRKAFRFALCERQGFRQDEDRALCDAFRVELFRFCRKHRLRQKAENFLFQFVITQ